MSATKSELMINSRVKYILIIVRALVTSSKPPCLLADVLKDYIVAEGQPLPFRDCGYNSAEALLRATGEFHFAKLGSQVIISARPNENGAHIVRLVKEQNSSRKPTRHTQHKPPGRNYNISVSSNKKSGYNSYNFDWNNNNGWNHTCVNNNNGSNYYNQNYNSKKNPYQQQQQQVPVYQHQHQQQDLRVKLNAQRTQQLLQEQRQPVKVPVPQQQQQKPKATPVPKPEKKPEPTLTERLHAAILKQKSEYPQRQSQEDEVHVMANEAKMPRPILGQKNTATAQQHQHQHQHQQEQPSQTSGQLPATSTPPMLSRQPAAAQLQQTNGTAAYGTKSTIQNRLRLGAKQQQMNNGGSSSCSSNSSSSNGLTSNGGAALARKMQDAMQTKAPTALQSPSSMRPSSSVMRPKFFQFNSAIDPITSLAQYAQVRGHAPPIYSGYRVKATGKYMCQVDVNGTLYSTYPDEHSTGPMAQMASAFKAIEQIKEHEARQRLPPCPDSDRELLAKLHAEMLSHPCGIFVKNLPDWFGATFNEALPEHWWSLVIRSNKFIIEEGINTPIVLANKNADSEDAADTTVIQMDAIKLPWSVRTWDLSITYCASTVEVWARLIGTDYSQRYEALLANIDEHMLRDKARPVSIACQSMYLVYQLDSWHRVRVEEMDKVEGKALCCFIDFGDVCWLPVDQLYICEARFLQLPAQAVPFSLFGLEDFAENPSARDHLDRLLTTKSLLADVCTKEAEFSGKVQVSLIDTNTNKDILLNQLLIEEISNKTPVPKLNPNEKFESVMAMHISQQGDVYLRLLNDAGWEYVQKLTRQLIEAKFKRVQHQVTREELRKNSNNLFLICDDNEKLDKSNGDSSSNTTAWYRGRLAPAPASASLCDGVARRADDDNVDNDDDTENMYLIDFGETRQIAIANIFRLEQLSMALYKFPPRAIKVRLHDIPDTTPTIVGRIRALLPVPCKAMTNCKSDNSVEIYRHTDTFCLINAAIRAEHELSVSSAADRFDGFGTGHNGDNNGGVMSPTKLDRSGGVAGGGVGASGGGSTPTTPTSAGAKTFIDLTRGLTVLTSLPDSPQKTGEFTCLKDYDAFLPPLGDLFEVRVTMSANPTNFTIQPYKDYPKLRTLMKELQAHCEASDEFIPVDMVELNGAYAAKNPDGFYHRVTVVGKFLNDLIHVCYCDFGDIEILSNAQLKTLPARFRQLPKMALQAKLHGITARNGDWTLDDCLRFRELTVGQKFFSIIKKISYDTFTTSSPTQILELELIDVTTDEDVLIHEQLLKEKRAIAEK